MNTKTSLKKTIALLSAAALTMTAPNYAAAGNNAEDFAANPAYDCISFGSLGIHCYLSKLNIFNEEISTIPASPMRVYEAETGDFAGTEQHLSNDIYNGQSCPQTEEAWATEDGEWGEYHGYKFCHHQ